MRTEAQTPPTIAGMPVLAKKQPVKVACGVCKFVASALTESRALRGWAYHRIHVHGVKPEGAKA